MPSFIFMKRHKWTYDECIELARKYIYSSDLKKHEQRACKAAQKNGWLKDYNWFIPHFHPIKWTYESCYLEAKKYKNRVQFEKSNESAYNKALHNYWLKDYTWMPLLQKPKGYWNVYEHFKEECKKYSSRSELLKKIKKHMNLPEKIDG